MIVLMLIGRHCVGGDCRVDLVAGHCAPQAHQIGHQSHPRDQPVSSYLVRVLTLFSALRKMPMIMLFPIWKYIALLGLIAWTIFIWTYADIHSDHNNTPRRLLVTSSRKVTENINTQLNETAQISVEPDKLLQGLGIYYALGFFWTYNWIVAITQCTIAGAIASWYWARDKNVHHSFHSLNNYRRCRIQWCCDRLAARCDTIWDHSRSDRW